jgi:hypothetical protein
VLCLTFQKLLFVPVSDSETGRTSSASSVAASVVLHGDKAQKSVSLANILPSSPTSTLSAAPVLVCSQSFDHAVDQTACNTVPVETDDCNVACNENLVCSVGTHAIRTASVASAAANYSDLDDFCSTGITVGSSDQCDILDTTFESVDSSGLTSDACVSVSVTAELCNNDLSSIKKTSFGGDGACCCAVPDRVCRTTKTSFEKQNLNMHRHLAVNAVASGLLPAEYDQYAVPVMAAQLYPSLHSSALLSSATSSCNTLTVSSPSFSLPLCAPVATKPGGPSTDSLVDVTGASLSKWLMYDVDVLSEMTPTAVSANHFMHRAAHASLPDFVGQNIIGQLSGTTANVVRANTSYRLSTSAGISTGLPADVDCLTDNSRHISQSARIMESCLADYSTLNRTEPYDALLNARNGPFNCASVRSGSDAVCSVTTPVMANVLLQSGFSSPGSDRTVSENSTVRPSPVQQSNVPVAGLSLLRTVGLQDVSSIISALIGQQVSGQTASQQGETILPVIAIFNVGHANLGLPVPSNSGALPFFNVPLTACVARQENGNVNMVGNLQLPAGCI